MILWGKERTNERTPQPNTLSLFYYLPSQKPATVQNNIFPVSTSAQIAYLFFILRDKINIQELHQSGKIIVYLSYAKSFLLQEWL